MKKTAYVVGGIVLSILSANVFAQTWDSKSNPTVDSITAKYKDKMVSSKPTPGINDVFPAIGQYESDSANTSMITITMDEHNKGIVWIAGAPQGRIKALLRKSPATYKIPNQQDAEGKPIAEGTLVYDKEENKLHILIGKPYNDAEPMAIFSETEPVIITNTKTKTIKKPKESAVWRYTGTKVDNETVIN